MGASLFGGKLTGKRAQETDVVGDQNVLALGALYSSKKC